MSQQPLFQQKEEDPKRGATIKGIYRYDLWRFFSLPSVKRVCFVMLNPSVADAKNDDPTLRRCIGFAKTLGFDGLELVNLYALRSTDPVELKMSNDPVGPECDHFLTESVRRAQLVICAWGMYADFGRAGRQAQVIELLAKLRITPHVFGLTGRGCPLHPLYLPSSARPIPWDDLVKGEG